MNFENLETYKGLIKLNNISELGFLKKSCVVKFFEDATYFTKTILKNTTIRIPSHSVPAFKPAKVFVDNVKNNNK